MMKMLLRMVWWFRMVLGIVGWLEKGYEGNEEFYFEFVFV